MSYQFAEHTSQMEWFHQDSEAVVNQTSSRPRNSETVTMTFLFLLFGARLALGSVLELLRPTAELVIIGCHIKSTFHHMSQFDQEMVHYCCKD